MHSMTILAQIRNGYETYSKALLYLLHGSAISTFFIEGQRYFLFYPVQALALQRIGVELEYYETNKHLHREFPIVPRGLKLTKLDLTPEATGTTMLDDYVGGLHRYIAAGQAGKKEELRRLDALVARYIQA